MKFVVSIFAFSVFLISVPLRADQKDTDFDPATDFLKFKTFTIRQGQITAKAPELNSPLVRKKIEDSIRQQLVAKGLTEVQSRPDLAVNFRFGAADRRQVESFPAGRWGLRRRLETFRFTEGTLVINLMDTDGRQLVCEVYTATTKAIRVKSQPDCPTTSKNSSLIFHRKRRSDSRYAKAKGAKIFGNFAFAGADGLDRLCQLW